MQYKILGYCSKSVYSWNSLFGGSIPTTVFDVCIRKHRFELAKLHILVRVRIATLV